MKPRENTRTPDENELLAYLERVERRELTQGEKNLYIEQGRQLGVLHCIDDGAV